MSEPATTTKMTAEPKRTKLVKVRATQKVAYTDAEGNQKYIEAGRIAEIPVEEAKRLSVKKQGYFAFGGERFGKDGEVRHIHQKVEIVRERKVEEDEFSA